jgi:hypothetical protein
VPKFNSKGDGLICLTFQTKPAAKILWKCPCMPSRFRLKDSHIAQMQELEFVNGAKRSFAAFLVLLLRLLW